jgi:hypothetical protein
MIWLIFLVLCHSLVLDLPSLSSIHQLWAWTRRLGALSNPQHCCIMIWAQIDILHLPFSLLFGSCLAPGGPVKCQMIWILLSWSWLVDKPITNIESWNLLTWRLSVFKVTWKGTKKRRGSLLLKLIVVIQLELLSWPNDLILEHCCRPGNRSNGPCVSSRRKSMPIINWTGMSLSARLNTDQMFVQIWINTHRWLDNPLRWNRHWISRFFPGH